MNGRLRVLAALLDRASRGAFSRELALIDASQWRTPAEIATLQNERLTALLQHAEATVPFYQRRFAEAGIRAADIRTPADLERLPMLTKADVTVAPDELRSTSVPAARATRKVTGGSTGEMMVFLRDAEAMARNFAHVLRNYEWTGLVLGEPHTLLWGAHFDLKSQQRLSNRVINVCLRQRWLDAFHMDAASMRRHVDQLRADPPALLSAYATAATTLADYLEEQQLPPLDLPAVATTAEMLFPEARAHIARWLSAQVFDRFGCREVGNTAHECEAHDGLHVNAEHVVLEVVGPDGRAVTPGTEGEILYTTLGNRVFPLIRYRVGDFAVRRDPTAGCRCGRGLPRIGAPRGRITDMLVTVDGTKVHGEFFTHLFYTMPTVRKFRVVQDTVDTLRIYVVLRGSDALTPADDARLRRAVTDAIGPGTRTEVHVVADIPPSASGKHLFTESRVRGPRI